MELLSNDMDTTELASNDNFHLSPYSGTVQSSAPQLSSGRNDLGTEVDDSPATVDPHVAGFLKSAMGPRIWTMFSSKISESEEKESAGIFTGIRSDKAQGSATQKPVRGMPSSATFPKKEDYMRHGSTSLCVIAFLVKVEIVKDVLRKYATRSFSDLSHSWVQSHSYSSAPSGVVFVTPQSILNLCHWSNLQVESWSRRSDAVSILAANDTSLRDLFFVLYHRLYKKDPPPSHQVFQGWPGSEIPAFMNHDSVEADRRLRVARGFTGKRLDNVIAHTVKSQLWIGRNLTLQPFGTHGDIAWNVQWQIIKSSVTEKQTQLENPTDSSESSKSQSWKRGDLPKLNIRGSPLYRGRTMGAGHTHSDRPDARPTTSYNTDSSQSFGDAERNNIAISPASITHDRHTGASSSPVGTDARFRSHFRYYKDISSKGSSDSLDNYGAKSQGQLLQAQSHGSGDSKSLKRSRSLSLGHLTGTHYVRQLNANEESIPGSSKQLSGSEVVRQHSKPLAKRRRRTKRNDWDITQYKHNSDNGQKSGEEKGSSSGSGELSFAASRRGSPASYNGSGSDSNSGSFYPTQAEYMARPSTQSSLEQIFVSVERSINSRQSHSRNASFSSR
ncbi:hypothetical protein M408DRAFT_26091 [Serendipita vermifera MAFF 305830]|uniref:Uncharacterized protein n=1 Tax=Serendipita vermifera MAFF 305830 TaxID=933852 RepID=A0A0C3AZY6_SERVB|nr:hypothetical protein M408DRAFT_26091 [Serendipita vermifera MAFF 305830]